MDSLYSGFRSPTMQIWENSWGRLISFPVVGYERPFRSRARSRLRLTVEDAPADADVDVLPHALETYNEGRWPQHPPWLPLAIFLRDETRIVAGLAGETYCGWLFVKYLWVSEGLRGRGSGAS